MNTLLITWMQIAEGTTIGYKRLIRFSDSKIERIRVTIRSARGTANIMKTGLFYTDTFMDKDVEMPLSDVPVDKWRVIGGEKDAALAIDGDRKTVWRTESLNSLVVDMGYKVPVNGFSYTPATGEDLTGTIYKYNFYVSADGETWERCGAAGEFSNIML